MHAEPPLGAEAARALAEDGWDVRLWPERHHYFGGTSVVARTGAGADPRRDGAALTVSSGGTGPAPAT